MAKKGKSLKKAKKLAATKSLYNIGQAVNK
jgi:hypothetical protein